MANSIHGNKVYIDATGTVTTDRVRVTHILFTPDAANDTLTLQDTSGGDSTFTIRGSTAKNTVIFDFSSNPLVFNNGIIVQTLSTSATALLVTTTQGK